MADLKPSTSPYEVLALLTDRVASGELASFDSLKEFCSPLPESAIKNRLLKQVFKLQRQLYWGFFKGISPETFPKVWSQVVLPDRKYPFAGDLKRYMTISDIYMGMVDIHGYTRYCHKNRGNMSMLDLLDRMMQIDIPKIAATMGVVTKRSSGDQILLLGAAAEDVLEAILRIMQYFARRATNSDVAKISAAAQADRPQFQISAGIAGGQKFTPLIITRDGDLSGDIVNTASRLQSRADKISPDTNKILLSSQAFQKVNSRPASPQKLLLDGVDFFNTGTIDFKGISIGVFDTVFMNVDAYRLQYRDCMEELYESLDKGMWKSKIFEDSLNLIAKISMSIPTEAVPPAGSDAAMRDLSKNGFMERTRGCLTAFNAERYEEAIRSLNSIVADMSYFPCVDELALDYLHSICDRYSELSGIYVKSLDIEVSAHPEALMSPDELKNFKTLKRCYEMYDRVERTARERVKGKKAIWYHIADEASAKLSVVIQSKK